MSKKTYRRPSDSPPAAGSAAGWKRCADEMPDSDSTVMIHHEDEDEPVWMGYHDGETWRAVDGARCAVSHWMPLPEPPSGDDKRQSDQAQRRRE